MSITRTWNLKSEISGISGNNQWDYCPNLFKNESFSSWFTRLAKGNYSEPFNILKGLDINVDNLDSYFFSQPEILQNLISPFLKTELKLDIFSLFFNKKIQFSKKIFYYKYCPKCLKLDKNPYFRKNWMNPFITLCHRHQMLLKAVCPHCEKRIQFWKNKWNESTKTCYNCHKDITHAIRVEKINEDKFFKDNWQSRLANLMIKDGMNIFELLISHRLRKLTLLNKNTIFLSKEEIITNILFTREKYPLQFTKELYELYLLIKSGTINFERLYACQSCDKIKFDYQQYQHHILICYFGIFCPSCHSSNLNIVQREDLIYCRECYVKFDLSQKKMKKKFEPQRIPDRLRKKNHVGIECTFCKSHDTIEILKGVKCKKCGSIQDSDRVLIKEGFLPPICPDCKSKEVYFRNKIFKFVCKKCKNELPIVKRKHEIDINNMLIAKYYINLKLRAFPNLKNQYIWRPKDRLHWIDRRIFEFIKFTQMLPISETEISKRFKKQKFTIQNTISHLIDKSLVIKVLYSDLINRKENVGYFCNYFDYSDSKMSF